MADRLLGTAHFWATQKQIPVKEIYAAIENVQPDGQRGKKQPTYFLSTIDTAILERVDSAGLDLNTERARLAKWQADKAEQEVQLRARRMLDADEVTEWVAGMFATVKARLVQVPDAVAQHVDPDHSHAVAEAVRRLVHEALADLAAERERGTGGGLGDVRAAAEPDGERLGGPIPAPIERVKRRAGAVAN